MSSKYKFIDTEGIYFVTSTIVGWADVFTKNIYRDILLNSFQFCQQNQGLQIYAWVLMPNHFHLICSSIKGNDLGMIIKNIKSFTAIKIIDAIINNPQESRKEWLLTLFEQYGAKNKNSYKYQFWQYENHPVLLDNVNMYVQRLNYLHENPVRSGFVAEPKHWLYSSVLDYYTTNQKGLLNIAVLE